MFSALVSLLIAALIFLTPFSFIAAAALAIVALVEKDPIKKKPFKKAALYCLVMPILILIVVLVLWGLVNAALHTFE